jgi:bacterioferritin
MIMEPTTNLPTTIFMTDIQTLREHARAHVESGAVTAGYSADRDMVLKLLNDAMATELVCMLRYRRHHFMARGIHSKGVADEFLVHANQELEHADQLATRIVQLGGEPDFNADSLRARSHAEYVECESLEEMIKENLVAERIAIDSYRDMIQYLADADPTTRRLLEGILAVEEEHADELADLWAVLPAQAMHYKPLPQPKAGKDWHG